ncbi:hypothetical protein SERLA73DRAFT_144954 [Serpula lacrymans var. lacrymans S7.3]|uniref:Uncharacterized protein n=2 Tax=Serpula lacrymans var. lacrymans TaxID=341189 RepID=F8QCQ6_SERL3|nr:uncharacterized protein SERLADRAFT_402684 [Serpula lacrymans var. lacrymans S7.9]EGN93921.1 hypothetical protein SERLA73DRAFT_144954 [Serpula lacrymans var. lacrymans S7.3]EGO19287.1 hypothetical protein SERLADRAFT_402684 [Serpula lacrymans var. lacrymans S7.9]
MTNVVLRTRTSYRGSAYSKDRQTHSDFKSGGGKGILTRIDGKEHGPGVVSCNMTTAPQRDL